MFFKLLKDWNGQKAGTQLTLADPDAAPLVQAGIMEAVRDEPITPLIAKGRETAMNGSSPAASTDGGILKTRSFGRSASGRKSGFAGAGMRRTLHSRKP